MTSQITVNNRSTLLNMLKNKNGEAPRPNETCAICRGKVHIFYIKGVKKRTCDCGKIKIA